MIAYEENLLEEIMSEYQFLVGDRGNFETHWREISERIAPNDKNQFLTRMHQTTTGEKRTQLLFDSTAAVALNRFAAILDSLLTPRNQTWHRLKASDPRLNKDRQVLLWFEDVNRLLFKYRYAPKANFSSQNQQNYRSLGAYGSGCVFVDELTMEPGLRYRNIHLGEIYFVENHQGLVDKAYRYFSMTARQAVQKWKDKVPALIRETKNQETMFWFIHCVKPREDMDPTRRDFKGMSYASYYVSESGRAFLSEGGFSTFPYAISRYEQAPGEVYGRSPAMDVLPAIKTLNEEKKTILRQGHRIVEPVLLAHDDGIVDTFSLKPGSINAGGVTADGRPLVHALPTGDLKIGKELMDDERKLINDAFLINLFQILTDTPTMSATECLERAKEKGILIAPTIGRQQSEYLGPMIEREIDVLAQQRIIPPMPQILREAKGEYHIQYDSPLSRSQRAEEAAGVQRTIESVLQVVNITQDPSPLDFFDWDTIVPEIADIQGVPYRWLKTMDAVNQIRQGRAQEKQINTAIQAAPGAAAVTKAGAIANQAQGK